MLRKATLTDDPSFPPRPNGVRPSVERGNFKRAHAPQQGGYQDESTSLKIELLSTSMS